MVDPYQKGGGASGTFRSPDSLSGLFVSGASTIGEKILFTRRANVTNSRRRAFLRAKDGDAAFFLPILLNILTGSRKASIQTGSMDLRIFRLVNLIVKDKTWKLCPTYTFFSPFAMNKRS